jgi:DNA-binding MarR family transcriptional regulator
VNGKLNNALNGLNFVKAFYTAYNSSSGLSQEKVSILHMEAFLFLMAHQDHDGIPLLNLQEALGHAQAKMQRLAVALQKVGWITLKKDPQDGRQRIVYLTEKGLALFDQLSPCFSEEKNDFDYQAASKSMQDSIADKAAKREVLMGAEDIVASAHIASKASMNVAVEVSGVSAKGETGDAQAASEYMADITKRAIEATQDKQKQAALEFELKTALRAVLHGESGKVEVGAGYVRTDRGIVTHKVLLKRLFDLHQQRAIDGRKYPANMFGVVEYLRDASDADYEKMLTPTPKTRRGKLEAEVAKYKEEMAAAEAPIRFLEDKFGLDHIFDTPHLRGTHTKYRKEFQTASALLVFTQQELVGLDALEEMGRMLEEIPNMTPEQEEELARIENKFTDQFDDFDVTEFPKAGETEKE